MVCARKTYSVQQGSAVIGKCRDMPAIFELLLLQDIKRCLIMVDPWLANVLRNLQQSPRDKCNTYGIYECGSPNM
jgi:hypothetical protein